MAVAANSDLLVKFWNVGRCPSCGSNLVHSGDA